LLLTESIDKHANQLVTQGQKLWCGINSVWYVHVFTLN